MELGDTIEHALDLLGINSERISRWLGRPCNCEETKEKINQLSIWAKRVAKGKLNKAGEYLSSIVDKE